VIFEGKRFGNMTLKKLVDVLESAGGREAVRGPEWMRRVAAL
jgi:hypothetical protein